MLERNAIHRNFSRQLDRNESLAAGHRPASAETAVFRYHRLHGANAINVGGVMYVSCGINDVGGWMACHVACSKGQRCISIRGRRDRQGAGEKALCFACAVV